MNKKAISEALIVIIILLVFFIIVAGSFFFFPNALWPKVAKITRGFEGFLPGKAEKEITSTLDTPQDVIDIFNSLYKAFSSSKGKENCFIQYNSLDIGKYKIELEYIEAEKGLNMILINEKQQQISSHFVSSIKPCITLPDKNDNIAKVSPLDKAEIKNNNELYYNGDTYDMFAEYPLLYAAKGYDWACFFTDDAVKDPVTGTIYGTASIFGWEGFDNDDMEKRMNQGIKCS